MRRLFLCAALIGLVAGLSGCDEKKPPAGSSAPTAAGPKAGAGPGAPPPPPPPPLPK